MKIVNLIIIFLVIIIHISKSNINIYDGAYIIKENDENRYLNIDLNTLFLEENISKNKAHFYLTKFNSENNINEDYYFIKILSNNNKLCSNELYDSITICPSDNQESISLWKIILIDSDDEIKTYKIMNQKSQKYISLKNDKIILSSSTEDNSLIFELYKTFELYIPKETEILKNEPIDVLIKYIDLNDPNLHRKNIKQISKDFDNYELKYCIRSILKNIPWIRKIFILMPNDRVRFLKSPELINDKIIYVKDIDLLGFECASIYVFQFNLWRMKKYGMSENFILMDDDYFISKPIKKEELFYEENNQILPAMIVNDFYLMDKRKIIEKHKLFLNNINSLKKIDTQSENAFLFRQLSTLKFFYKLFNKTPLIEASFTHNAIPCKQSDIKEIYDLVLNRYEFPDAALKSVERDIKSLHFQTLFLGYAINKYNRKANGISCKYIDIKDLRNYNIKNEKLFVINTSNKKVDKNIARFEKEFLEELFSEACQYELNEEEIKENEINDLRQKIIELNEEINKYKNNENKYGNKYQKIVILESIILIIIFLNFFYKRIKIRINSNILEEDHTNVKYNKINNNN